MVAAAPGAIEEWGPYILISYPLTFEDSPLPRGSSVYPGLDGVDFGDDSRVRRENSLEQLNPYTRSQLKLPVRMLRTDLRLTGVWTLTAPDGRLFRSDTHWHSVSNRSPRELDGRGTADLRIVRTLSQQPPALVRYGSPRDPGAAIARWTLRKTMIGQAKALYHSFGAHEAIDPVVQRAWLEADAVEWFDHRGYKNIVFGWGYSEAELRSVAENLE